MTNKETCAWKLVYPYDYEAEGYRISCQKYETKKYRNFPDDFTSMMHESVKIFTYCPFCGKKIEEVKP